MLNEIESSVLGEPERFTIGHALMRHIQGVLSADAVFLSGQVAKLKSAGYSEDFILGYIMGRVDSLKDIEMISGKYDDKEE